ncbi:alpha/beta-hydrolase [Gyrodon lividus]|nr:alpha/beta-hydrolase [Gyrodon lividus]
MPSFSISKLCVLCAITTAALLSSPANISGVAALDPWQYDLTTVKCPAVDRVLDHTVHITIEYVDLNPTANTTILMVHGWPSLWSSWARQIEEFKDEYHIIAIDVRGFGGSTHPPDVQSSSTLADITGDLVCVLEHARVSSAICLGHDWGAVACYEAARRRPDVFSAVIGVTVPYLPSSGPFHTPASLSTSIPTLSYQVFFERNTSQAVVELNRDIRRTLRGTLRSVDSPPPPGFLKSRETFLGGWEGREIPEIPYFSRQEEDYFVERFSRQGFDRSLIFYAHDNRYGTWKSAREQGNYTVAQPVLSVLPLNDPVADWEHVAAFLGVDEFLPGLTTKTMQGAHWPHMEFPVVFNGLVRAWLEGQGMGHRFGGGGHDGYKAGGAGLAGEGEEQRVRVRVLVDEL